MSKGNKNVKWIIKKRYYNYCFIFHKTNTAVPRADVSADEQAVIKTRSELVACSVCPSNVIDLINMQMSTLTQDLQM